MYSPIRLLKIGRDQFGLIWVLAVFLFYFMLGQPLQAATLERDHAADLVIAAKGDKPLEVPKLQDLKADDTDAFITVWEVKADDLYISIPISSTSTYNYSISLEKEGDPSFIKSSTGQTSAFSTTVNQAGRYIIKIRGDFPHFYFKNTDQKDRDKLVAVQQWGAIKWKSFANAFDGAKNLKSVPTESPDLSDVTDMSYMFFGASAFNGDLSKWNVSQVKDMSWMFYFASDFNGDLASWNVSNVFNMTYMFRGASAFNGNISDWDVSKVQYIRGMFWNASAFNQDLASWNISQVKNMSFMFSGASAFNGSLASWDVSNVIDMSNMLSGSGLSTSNYDKTLIGWANNKNGLKSNVALGADGLKWCNADDKRAFLINEKKWTITGDTEDCTDADDTDAFITVWEVTANDLNIHIPISSTPNLTYNYSISVEKEGDTSSVQSFTAQTSALDITVTEAGRYLVKIRGDFPHFNLKNASSKDRNKLVEVRQWGAIAWKSFASTFQGAKNLKSISDESPDLSLVTDMSEMFFGAVAFNGDLSEWNVSNVEDMSAMFWGASSFNGNVKDWDVSMVTDMSEMFSGAIAFNGDLANWNVSQVQDMSGMFSGASSFNGNVKDWDVSKVTYMESMFFRASTFDQDLSSWNVSLVGNMSYMFREASAFNGDVKDWDVSLVGKMSYMFWGASAFNGDLSKWNVSNVDNMTSMFVGASAFNGDLSKWNVSQVKYMFDMLSNSGLSRLNYDKTLIGWAANPKGLVQDVVLGANGLKWCNAVSARTILEDQYGWTITGDTEDCTGADDTDAFITVWEVKANDLNISMPISPASTYNYSISVEKEGDPSSLQSFIAQTSAFSYPVTEPGRYIVKIRGEFPHFNLKNASSKDKDKLVEVQQWGTIKWKSFASAFQGARNLKSVPTESPDLESVTDMSEMFFGASTFNGDLSSWDVSNVTNMSAMFSGAIAFNGDLSEWNVSNVEDMSAMFKGATDFNQDLASWDVSKVGDMSSMFSGASIFNRDLNSWDVSKVTKMSAMFSNAYAFNGDLSSWDVSKVTEIFSMFWGASSFNGDVKEWDVSTVTDMSEMFSRAIAFNGDLANWNVSQVQDMSGMFYGAKAFNGNLSKWDVSKVTKIVSMFSGAIAFNGNLKDWDVSSVTTMEYMFKGASAFNQDLSRWNVSLVGNMSYMFFGASAFNGDLSKWNVSQVNYMFDMLSNSGLSTSNYDKTLIGWAANPKGLIQGVLLSAEGLKWCTAVAARNILKNQYGWRITGDTEDCTDADDTDAFITVWEVKADDLNISIPVSPASTYNYSIILEKEGDPSAIQSLVRQTTAFSYTVTEPGRYIVKIRGDFPHFYFGNFSWQNKEKLVAVRQWGAIEWKSFASAFQGAKNLKSIPDESPDLSLVTDMSAMFSGAIAFNGDLSEWNVSNVEDMSAIFKGASVFNGVLSKWDVSNVKNMSAMFSGAIAFNQDLANWNVSKVEKMANMFSGASIFNRDLDSWNVSNVGDMSAMFSGASIFNRDLSSWNVSNVGNMSEMFSGATAFNGDIANWDVSNVGDMSAMFSFATAFNQDLANWNVWKVTQMGSMFSYASAFKEGIASWSVSNVEDMSAMFKGATAFNQDLPSWDVSKVTDMSFMFWRASAFKGDLSRWNVSKVTDMSYMFSYAFAFKGDLSRWNVAKVEDMSSMFSEASAFKGDLSRWNVAKVENMSFMFTLASAFNGDLSRWDVSKVTDMNCMFWDATAFNQDLASWDVSRVTEMRTMLSGSGLSSLNYDKTLIGWAANPKGLKSNVVLGADGLKWCTADDARSFLINEKKWIITEDEKKCIQADANNILYVSKSGPRGGTGSSWADALPELADALSWARTQADAGNGWDATSPLKIYVAVGTYTPLYHAADGKYTVDGHRDNSFVLVKNVQLYGGFDPNNGYDFHKRVQPKAGLLLDNPRGTILSADMLKDDKVTERNGALDFINYTDNAYHVLIAAGDLGEALVDGFVVQGGSAEGSTTTKVNTHDIKSVYGAGLHITKANPLLKNLNIAYNQAISGGGGGVFFYSSAANLFNISVNHNRAEDGGAICHIDSKPSLSNMTITNNLAFKRGAVLHNMNNSRPLVLNSIFYGNKAGNSLADNVVNDNSSTATFHHSLIAGDGLWNPSWGKDGDANDGQNSVTNLDPFMDREQGDFRLKRSSSAVDAGSISRLWAALQKADPLNFVGPMPAVTDARWGLDLAGAARILDGQVDMGAYEFSCPTVAPTADAQQSFCVDNVPTIASLMANGDAIKWYSAADGGTLYLATKVLVDGQTYYASQTKDGCESQSRVAVEVKLIALPDAPEFNAIQQLSYGDAPLSLSATASVDCELRWYSAETGGTPSLQASVAETNVIGEQFFWVSQVNTTTGCEGPRAKITVNVIKAIPKLGTLASLQKTYGDAAFTLSPPSSDSPGAFSYSSSATDVATVKDMEVTIIGAGSTRITLTQAATDYYNEATRTFDLLVDKAVISAVIFKDVSYTYDGTAKLVELTGLPSGVTVSYSNNRQINAGTYTATANITGGTNYVDQSLTAVLSIEKAAISAVIFKDASYTYDGTAKSVELTGLPSGVTVSYSNNRQINAGTYTATASINGGTNYVDQSLAAVLRIEKAVISAVIFKDASYTYDGTAKSLVLSTALPTDVTVSYSNNRQINAGTYDVTANITGRNYVDQSLTAVLRIDKAAISGVLFKDASYTYDGTARSVELTTALPSGATVSYSNNRQINAGTYDVTANITGRNYVDQSLTAVLRIAQKQQLISFGALAPVTKDAGLISLDISSNSSLPIRIYSENTAVATVAADGLQIVGAGTTVIRAEQAGDANHLAAAPVTQLLEVTAVKDPIVGIRVHQALSPNGDGINDFLRIDGIDNYPENKLLIFDSNGTVIQTILGYNNHSNYFDAAKGSKLMAKGTYFYTLSVKQDGTWHTEKGFFVLRY